MKKSKIKKYKFCPEFQAYYDTFTIKPPMKLCIKSDKRIRKYMKYGVWDYMKHLHLASLYSLDENSTLINWKNPNKKWKEN